MQRSTEAAATPVVEADWLGGGSNDADPVAEAGVGPERPVLQAAEGTPTLRIEDLMPSAEGLVLSMTPRTASAAVASMVAAATTKNRSAVAAAVASNAAVAAAKRIRQQTANVHPPARIRHTKHRPPMPHGVVQCSAVNGELSAAPLKQQVSAVMYC